MAFFRNLVRLGGLGRVLVLVLMILAPGVAWADDDDDDVPPWPDDSPRNELPMFGEGRFPEALQEANRQIVRTAYKTSNSLTASSNLAMDRGWEAVSEGDMPAAIRRFNEAWLLDRRNGAPYWGFGVILYKRDGDLPGAIKMMTRARRLLPGDPLMLVDYGRVLEESGKAADAAVVFLDAVSLDPNTPYAYVGLVRAYLKENNLQNALLFAQEGKERGDPISDELIAALEKLEAESAGKGASAKNADAKDTSVKYPAAPEWAP